jgi:hypothetical protein
VKAARAAVAITSGLAKSLASDWRKAVEFYARFGILEVRFRHGAESINEKSPEIVNVVLRLTSDSAGDGKGGRIAYCQVLTCEGRSTSGVTMTHNPCRSLVR